MKTAEVTFGSSCRSIWVIVVFLGVARHRENIMRKLNLHNRSELVKYAIRKGIITP